jgi:uncharacterized membrane protein
MAPRVPLRELTASQLRTRAAEYFRKAETTTTTQAAVAFARLGARYAAYAAMRETEERCNSVANGGLPSSAQG